MEFNVSFSYKKKKNQLPAKQSRPGSSCSFPKQITLSIISSKPWDLSHIVVVLVHHGYSSARDTRQVTFVMQCNIFFKTSWRKNKLVSEHKGNFQLFRWNFSYKLFLQTLRTLNWNLWIFYIKQRFKDICARHQLSDCCMLCLFLDQGIF